MPDNLTNEQRKQRLAALLRERQGYVNRGLDDRAALVDAEIKQLTRKAKPPAKQAEKRPAAKPEQR